MTEALARYNIPVNPDPRVADAVAEFGVSNF